MGIDVLTNRYENSRVGVNAKETVLNTKSVSIPTFGKLFARTVNGDLYAQPLVVSDLTIGGMKRDVVFLATSRNWVYAYDAEHPEEVLPLWSRNLGTPVPRDDIFPGYLNFAGEIGITSTPVIERDGKGGGTLYVVAKTRTVEDGNKSLRYEIHALNILTGRNRAVHGKPVVIAASVRNAKRGIVEFDARWHLNRAGLLLLKGVLYLAFGSHGDVGEFYGWIMAYDAHTLAQLAVCNTAPDWGQGGIWQSGTGLAGDAEGFVYAVVGNGAAPSNNLKKNPPVPEPVSIRKPDYGNAILKLELVRRKRGATLKIVNWFTASDTMLLNETDNDFLGGPVLFEAPPVPGSSGQFVLGGGKDGKFYLGDRTHLGKFMPGSNTAILQAERLCAFHIHGAPVVFKKSDSEIVAYVWSEKDFLQAFEFTGKKFDSRPLSTSVYGLPQDELRMPGGILSVSSNGTQDGSGIVWASHPTDDDGMNKTVKGTLRAYDARDLNNELWNSDMDAEGSDRVGTLAKFCPPVVANGKVYMATFSRELVVYGLFSETGRLPRSNCAGIFELRGVGPGIQQSGSYGCSRYDLRITGQGIGGKQDNFLFASVDRDFRQRTGDRHLGAGQRDQRLAIPRREGGRDDPEVRSNQRSGQAPVRGDGRHEPEQGPVCPSGRGRGGRRSGWPDRRDRAVLHPADSSEGRRASGRHRLHRRGFSGWDRMEDSERRDKVPNRRPLNGGACRDGPNRAGRRHVNVSGPRLLFQGGSRSCPLQCDGRLILCLC